MSERYFITEAQIGIIRAMLTYNKFGKIVDLLDEIEDKQFVGNIKSE